MWKRERIAMFCIVQFSEAFLWENSQFSHTIINAVTSSKLIETLQLLWKSFEVRNLLFVEIGREEKKNAHLTYFRLDTCDCVYMLQISTFHIFSVSIEKLISIVFICEIVTQFTHSSEFEHFHSKRTKNLNYEIELFKFDIFSARKMWKWINWAALRVFYLCVTLMMLLEWLKVFPYHSQPTIIIQTEIDLISLKSINFITKCCYL